MAEAEATEMTSETLLRAYRLAVQREARAWELVPRSFTGVGTRIPDYILDQWRKCQAKQERYARLALRIESRLLARLGEPPE